MTFHRIGYARVSSAGQNLDSQIDALQKAGCEKIFSDKMTGSHMGRPGWDQFLEYARPGDALVVSELSRMTRSLMDLLTTAKLLEQRQINLVSLRENIDTTTATGRSSAKARGKTGLINRCGLARLHKLAGVNPAQVIASHEPGIEPCRHIGNDVLDA